MAGQLTGSRLYGNSISGVAALTQVKIRTECAKSPLAPSAPPAQHPSTQGEMFYCEFILLPPPPPHSVCWYQKVPELGHKGMWSIIWQRAYIHTQTQTERAFARRFHIILYVSVERTTPQLTRSLWHIYSIVARRWLRAKKLLLNAPAQIAETRALEKSFMYLLWAAASLATGPACDWWIDWTRPNYKFIVRDADFYILISAWAACYSSRAIHQTPSLFAWKIECKRWLE